MTCWSAAARPSRSRRKAHEIGHVATLRLAEFQRAAESFLHLQSTAVFRDYMAFLPEVLKRQAMRIFTLFGFNAVSVELVAQGLMKELKHGAGLVVFDQVVRASKVAWPRVVKICSLLRAERRQQRQLAVIIIKDFDQGSLFGDMVTMAKILQTRCYRP